MRDTMDLQSTDSPPDEVAGAVVAEAKTRSSRLSWPPATPSPDAAQSPSSPLSPASFNFLVPYKDAMMIIKGESLVADEDLVDLVADESGNLEIECYIHDVGPWSRYLSLD